MKIGNTIRQFDVKYRVTLSGQWTKKGFSRPLFSFKEELPFLSVTSTQDTNLPPIEFFHSSYDAKDTDDNLVLSEVWASVRGGDFPIGKQIDEVFKKYNLFKFMFH